MTARVLSRSELAKCPDCGSLAFGSSHDGNCLLAPITVKVAQDHLIRHYAQTLDVVSANEVRQRWEREGHNPNGLSAAFTRAVKAGWLRKAGHTPSTDERTKKHEVSVYESLIHPNSSAA